MLRVLLLSVLLSGPLSSANSSLVPLVSISQVPPGGTAQIAITLASPVALVHGTFSVDVDSSVFGSISAVNVFSASGDHAGNANIYGNHAEIFFISNSGSVGRLPNLPVVEITVPVLASAASGALGQVTVKSTAPWRDIAGNQYTVAIQGPAVTVGNGISIQSVVPGGGPVPAGTTVQINGLGFTATTTLQLDGVNWSNLRFVSAHMLTFTLAGAADLEGKLFVLTNSDGGLSRYYSAITPTVNADSSVPAGLQPIFPRITYMAADFVSPNFALENDTLKSADVVLMAVGERYHGDPPFPPNLTLTIPAGGVAIGNYFGNVEAEPRFQMSSTVPIRALQWSNSDGGALYLFPKTIDAGEEGTPSVDCRPLFYSPDSVTFSPNVWGVRVGDPPPPPFTCNLGDLALNPIDFTVVAGPDDGNPWLTASPIPGANQFTVSMDPNGLSLGPHNGIVTLVPKGSSVPLARNTFQLNVGSVATVASSTNGLDFSPTSPAATFPVLSGSASVPVTVTSSDSWLSVTPAQGTTPLTITVQVLPSALTSQSQTLTATITIQGPGNTLTIPVYWYNPGGSAPPSTVLDIAFSAPAGSNIALVVTEDIPESTGVEVATNSGGNWMNAALKSEYLYQVEITADPYGLAAGTYTGTVVVQPQEVSSNPITFPVTLFVWSGPAPMPTASPTSLSVSYQAGQNITSSLVTVSTGALSLPITSATEEDDGLLLQLQNRQSNTDLVTPDSFAVFASADYPGIYHGQITFTAPAASGNSVIVPLTLTVSPAIPYTGLTPLISSLANAASLLPGSIAPGEMVSIFCLTPPDTSSGLHVGQDGKVNTSSYGNRVLFNGIPAPLIYTSATQINAIVPYEIAGSTTATVELDMSGIHSLPWSVPVAQSAPGLFTQNGSGQGAAAILNQDNSLNTPSNPAARGSIVQMFLTGEGQTNPPGITGEVTQTDTKTSLLAVRVQIGGVDAKVLSATSAPDAVAGLFQINAQIPATASSGTRAVAVWIGSSLSQGTATISVQ